MEGMRLQKVKNEGSFSMINFKSPILLIFDFEPLFVEVGKIANAARATLMDKRTF